jgi:hypothetical protein
MDENLQKSYKNVRSSRLKIRLKGKVLALLLFHFNVKAYLFKENV